MGLAATARRGGGVALQDMRAAATSMLRGACGGGATRGGVPSPHTVHYKTLAPKPYNPKPYALNPKP
jgi:hypothetical protein